MRHPPGLYHPSFEHDACGLGALVQLDGTASHGVVRSALEALANLDHRGASGSDSQTGDGAGITVQQPDRFLRSACRSALELELPPPGGYATGLVFLPRDPGRRLRCEELCVRICAEEGHRALGWRDVAVRPEEIGQVAQTTAPVIRMLLVERRSGDEEAFERSLYVIRRRVERAALQAGAPEAEFSIVSLSARRLVYKGLLRATQLGAFYPELRDPRFESALALVHSRFSTNTLGTWDLAHPYRFVAHNGEINTLRGNINWMRARESRLESPLFGEDIKKLFPVVSPDQSDSATFDNALELLYLAGRSLPHAVAMMMPEAWENDDLMDEERRTFYEYHSSLMEPWDGPAAISFTDGKVIGATLDRNGLRPARYFVTRDGRVVMASEDGALRVPAEDVVERWRLQPGKMLVVDTEKHELLHDEDVKKPLFQRRPYKRWVEEGEIHLDELPDAAPNGQTEPASLFERQLAFGYTNEDLRITLSPMARGGKEADGSMGTDTPLAVLSERPQLLFSYFKQLFAQVTNPPIDPLREELVMSLNMSLGPEQNLFDETPEHCRLISLNGPVLTGSELEKIRRLSSEPFRSSTLPMLFPANEEN